MSENKAKTDMHTTLHPYPKKKKLFLKSRM